MQFKIQFIDDQVKIDGQHDCYISPLGSEIIDLFECNCDFSDYIMKEPWNPAAIIIRGIYGNDLTNEQKQEIHKTASMIKEYASILLDESPDIEGYSSLTPIDRYLRLSVFDDIFISCNISFDRHSKKIVETYKPNNFSEACYIIFIKMIQHNITIKRCKNCGGYFLKRIGYNNEYCRRDVPGRSGKTCQDLGALIKYRSNSDYIRKVYDRSYKRHAALKRNGKMTQKAFSGWLKKAQKLRTEARTNKMSEEEFTIQMESISFKLIG